MNRKAQFNLNVQDILPEQPTFEYYSQQVYAVAFHPSGNLLAVGTTRGPIGLWELEVQDNRNLVGHVSTVSGLEWINGDLYSCSHDMTIIVWNIASGIPITIIRCDAPILSIHLNPVDPDLLLIRYSDTELVVCHISNDFTFLDIPILKLIKNKIMQYKRKIPEIYIVAEWSYNGTCLLFGDCFGEVTIFNISDLNTNELSVTSSKFRGTYRITDIKAGKNNILVNASDGELRLYNSEFYLLHSFQDIVNKYPWSACTFSNDFEYILACDDSYSAANLFVYETCSGRLVKTLDPYNVKITDLVFHPLYNTLACITIEGKLTLHSLFPTFSWGAFEPRFKEIEENAQYDEDIDDFTKAVHICADNCDCYEEIYMNHNLPSATHYKHIFPGHIFNLKGYEESKSTHQVEIVDIEKIEDIDLNPPKTSINCKLPKSTDLYRVIEHPVDIFGPQKSDGYPILPPIPQDISMKLQELVREQLEC